jgi:hypothetical protein
LNAPPTFDGDKSPAESADKSAHSLNFLLSLRAPASPTSDRHPGEMTGILRTGNEKAVHQHFPVSNLPVVFP